MRIAPHDPARIALALVWAAANLIAFAQPGPLRFHHLDNTNGLPQNSVNTMLEDRYGFLWSGTQDGLCRYDGHGFITYRNDGTANSLSNNYVWTSLEAQDGALWIGTYGGGLDRYDPGTGAFSHFRHAEGDPRSLSSDRVLGLLEHPAGALWVRTGKGLDRLDMETGSVQRYIEGGMAEGDLIGAMAPGDADHLLLQGRAGLLRFTMSTGGVEVLKQGQKTGTEQEVTALTATPEAVHVLENHRLYRIDPRTAEETALVDVDSLSGADPKMGFQCFLLLKDHILIGTTHGLVLMVRSSGATYIHRHRPDDPSSLADDHVLSIHAGRGGEIWVGTRNGLDRIDRLEPTVHALTHSPGDTNGLLHASVTALIEDLQGRIWIGSPSGLTIWDRAKDSFRHLRHDPINPGSLGADYVLSLAMDGQGRILVGTLGGGLNEVVERDGKIEIKRHRPVGLDDPRRADIVHHILPTADGTVWLATGGAGLCRLNSATGELSCQGPTGGSDGPSHPYLFTLLKDDAGYLWTGTAGGGLLLRSPDGTFGTVKHEPEDMGSLSADLVLCLYQDPKGRLWAGTVNGLCRTRGPLNPELRRTVLEGHAEEGMFKRYNRADGLPNEVIYGIQPDGRGHLWLSTNDGLVEWDPDSGTVLRVLDQGDGLPGDEFNQNAFLKGHDGTLYFGGANGLSWFREADLATNTRLPPVLFTGIALYNKPLPVRPAGTGDDLALDRPPHQLEQLDLAWHHHVLTFTFAALNFIAPEKNRYRYRLEGFDERWVDLGPRNDVTFTNLAPGSYRLHVQAANNDGVWNTEGAALAIHVLAPPWLRWYAYLVYAGLLGGVLYAVFSMRLRMVRREAAANAHAEKAKAEQFEGFRRRSAADFHDEAGARITRINLFTGLVRQRAAGNPELVPHLLKIETASRELSAGIRDLIWTMDPTRDSLGDTVERLTSFGLALFDATPTAFKVTAPPPSALRMHVTMETRRAITLLMKEAMNNCAKYAGARRCNLSARMEEAHLVIDLEDDGSGFDTLAQRSADHRGLRNMQQRASEIGAALGIHSAAGQGTKITLRVPMGSLQAALENT